MITFANDNPKPIEKVEDLPVSTAPPISNVDWAHLVEQIREDEPQGMEELYKMFSRGVRLYLCRQLGIQELDDKVHDTFLIVVNAIKRGDLREPERLMGFVRTVVRRQVASHIDHIVHQRKSQIDMTSSFKIPDSRLDPESQVLDEEKVSIMTQVLNGISRRDREILIRFYLHEESQEKICEEMGLSETQFRLLKSRAKARFGSIGKERLTRNNPENKSMRASASSSD